MSLVSRLLTALRLNAYSSSQRRAALLTLHLVVLLGAFLLEPPVPRDQSQDWWCPSRFDEDRGGLAIRMVPPGCLFVADRLWHFHYLPLPTRLYSVFLLPAILTSWALLALLHIPFPAITPWVHSWLAAALFIPISCLQVWLVANAVLHRGPPPATGSVNASGA